ncbi:MAG: PAS domain S-box protein [Acidimicrobiales bacterium]
MVALAPNGILLVDRDGNVVLANRQAEEMFGYEPGELLAAEVNQLVPAQIRNLHRAHREAYHRDPRTRPMGSGLDLYATRRDGTTFPVEIALSPLELDGQEHVVAIVRDISDRVQAERRIREVQQTLDVSQEGVFVFDADTLQVVYANRGAAAQVGRTLDELTGMSALDINPNYDEREFRALLQPLIARQVASRTVVTTHRHHDGSTVDVECVFQSPEVFHDGERRSVVAFARDITDRLATERILQDREQELSVLEDRERIARDLHDTVIQRLFAAGMSLQAAAAQAGSEIEARVGVVIDELDQTIRDIRQTIFRLTAHTLEPASLRRQIIEVVEKEEAVLGFAPEVRFNGPIESMDPDRSEHVVAVLRETLSNVARHAEASRVEVTVDVGDELTLTVTDDGIGVPADAVPGGGTVNLHQRAAGLDGTVEVVPVQPRGTQVRWSVPAG